jgi:type VI secretion system protein ImpF
MRCVARPAFMKFEPFLLDRLCHAPDDLSRADASRWALSMEQVKDSVARDLESLLNTRTALCREDMKPWRHASQSVLTYGLMDFAGLSLDNPEHREVICQSIASAIKLHEPRLREVLVSLESASVLGLGLRFTIHAKLVINPAVEPVSFDALLQPTTQRYAVRQNGRLNEMARSHG